jgi:hypothetical protein
MPECEDLDATGLCVDLVVEVIAGPAQEEAADALLPHVASTRSDARLCRNQLEGPLKVLGEGERGSFAVGPPPRGGSPDLRRSA